MIKGAGGEQGETPLPVCVPVVDEVMVPPDETMIMLEEQLVALDEELAARERRGLPPEEWPETRARAVASARPGVVSGGVVAVATERVIAVPPRVAVDPSAVDVSDPVARDLACSAPGAALLDHLERLAVLDAPGSACEFSDAVLEVPPDRSSTSPFPLRR